MLQRSEDDHGEKHAASHRVQLQQARLRSVRAADVQARFQHGLVESNPSL